jgi:hypothetical protein
MLYWYNKKELNTRETVGFSRKKFLEIPIQYFWSVSVAIFLVF